MMPVLVCILVILVFIVCLLAFVCARQAGILIDRLPQQDILHRRPALEPGDILPTKEVQEAGGAGVVSLLADLPEPTVLIFAAFSCSRCKPILQHLERLDLALRNRIVLLLLDRLSPGELPKHPVAQSAPGVVWADGRSIIEQFNPPGTPYGYLVSTSGVILEARRLYRARDLDKLLHDTTASNTASEQETPNGYSAAITQA